MGCCGKKRSININKKDIKIKRQINVIWEKSKKNQKNIKIRKINKT